MHVFSGNYNQSLTTGFVFIFAIIALPLGVFLAFGWVELVRNLPTFRHWLPAARFPRFKRTLAVSAWRQLDVAYVPYLLCLGILVAALVVDAPAKYAPLHEYDLPDGHTKVEAYVSGPDQHLWVVSHYFNVTTSRSQVITTEHYWLGYIENGGREHLDRYTLPGRPFCSLEFYCPFYIGQDGSLAYLGTSSSAELHPKLIRVTAKGSITTLALPANALEASAVFDGSGNLWYLRTISSTKVALSEMTPIGQVTDDAYQPTTDLLDAHDGTIWLTDSMKHDLVHIRRDGSITAAHVALPTFAISQLAVAPDASLWFVERKSGTIGHLMADGTFAYVPLHQSNHALDLAVGANGRVWLVDQTQQVAGVLSPQGAPTAFPLHVSLDDVLNIAVGNDANLYLMLKQQIVRVTPQGEEQSYDIPTLNADFGGLTTAPDGHLWFSEMPTSALEDWSILGEIVL